MDPTFPRWLRQLRLLAVLILSFALAACAAHGSTAHRQPAGAARLSAPEDPQMVMITLGGHFAPSNIAVRHDRQVMFMIVNRTSASQTIAADMPVASETVEDVSSESAPKTSAHSPQLTIAVPAGDEIDVTFVPTRTGSYAFHFGATPMGSVTVN